MKFPLIRQNSHLQSLVNNRLHFTLILLVAVIVVLPIVFLGIPDSSDVPQHFRFAQTFYDALINGNLFPGWAGNENFGYGDVGIRFYPPFEYYFLAFARILAGNWYDAAWLTFIFWMFLGCLGVYFWTKCWFPEKESVIAACLYAFIPFHLYHLYVSFNNYSEFAASSILTFCFAFLTRIFQHGKFSDVLGLAIFYALLILTHLPLTVIGSLSLFVYSLSLLRKKNLLLNIFKSVAAVGLALFASSFYWVKMISEINWIYVVLDRFRSGYFGFDSGFFPLYFHSNESAEIVWIFDLATVLTLIFLASAVIYVIYKKHHKLIFNNTNKVFQTVLPLGLFAFFMFTPLSRPIWIILTPLQRVQFPSRWMPVVSMCGAVVAAASIHYLLKGKFFKQRIWSYGFVIIAVTIALFDFIYIIHPTSFVPSPRTKFDKMIQDLPEEPSFDYWWAIWSKPEAFNIKEKVRAENREIEITEWQTEQRSFIVFEGIATKARIASFYYPHWKATVNNVSVEIEKDANGVMLIPVTAEKAFVKVHFQEPLKVKIAYIFSIFTWLLFGCFVVFLTYKSFFTKRII